MSKLRQWRMGRGLTQADASKMIEVTSVAWGRYENGRFPEPPVMQRIIELTGGEVTANDWYEIPQKRETELAGART